MNEASATGNLEEKCALLTAEVLELTTRMQAAAAETEALLKAKETEIFDKTEKISELETLIKWYEERLKLNARKLYGQSSEQSSGGQLGFFDEAEVTADKKAPEPDIEEITYKRKKRAGKREEDFSALPVETVVHELPQDKQTCPECGEPLHVMGKEVRKELTIVPAQVKVTEHVRYIYSCRNCEKTGITVPVVKASVPEPVIKGSAASPSIVAHIMAQKYTVHTPLYRQEQEFQRQGLSLSRQTMANWMIKASGDWLEPVYGLFKKELLSKEILHADETKLQVLREPGRKASSESYMWLYRTGGDADKPVVLYDYQQTRSSAHPKRFLDGWKGYLHTDGYQGYHSLVNVAVAGCWAHARRRFDEALTGLKPEERRGSKAQTGLDFCNRLFALEEAFDGSEPDERLKQRLLKSKPVADEFFAWAEGLNALPQSLLGKAVNYAVEQKPYLMNVFLDGRLELSNNRAERSIKPFVMGRKNWLFCNTENGARASAVIYSVIETAKENGLKPFEYLKFLFESIPNSTTSQLPGLLPWGAAVPQECRLPKSKN